MDAPLIYIVGTAGSGKSSLAAALKLWMDHAGHDAVLVNLDPGAEDLPYLPDIDIRQWVSLQEVMAAHGLGPNGGQVAAADMIALNAAEVAEALEGYRTECFIIDTPGQIELFAFRSSSRTLIEVLGMERALIIFLMDANLCKNPNGFASALMLSATVQFRLGIPHCAVIAKADLLTDGELEEVLRWSEDFEALDSALYTARDSGSRLMSIEALRALRGVEPQHPLMITSAEDMEGMEQIYAHVQQHFAGGEEGAG
ncbi:MAG: ATP/GTP-binding protein [Candidatus Thermoplasmatota archaeon]